ncbi:helix-turn-helix domain-containing protein [Bacillus sp. Marseille-Q3570]|uniref:helix-turn-helix domain-containing protein n=1 Tax=Bacillus sp. Marseille-Q3570 TaxID=2963522 RepID=UPI0021B80ACF|nr:XRE family transcriptional regulator [Bacillus sp. Marseille-Q3570]
MSHEINHMIGKKIKMIRADRKLSLDELSKLTNVSKAMLGQIERGTSSPTVSTLWKIASGLGVSFSSFVEEDAPTFSKVRIDDVEPLLEDDGRYLVHTLFPTEPNRNFEAYAVTLKPGCSYTSPAHGSGVEEYLFVHKGELNVLIGDSAHSLKTGEAIRFSADYEHTYENTSSKRCELYLIIHYR